MKHTLENGVLTISISGNVLSTVVNDLQRRIVAVLDEVESTSWRTLNLDLTQASMIDSMGLNLLVTLLKRVEQGGGKVRISIRNKNLDRLFRFTRLNEHAEIVHA